MVRGNDESRILLDDMVFTPFLSIYHAPSGFIGISHAVGYLLPLTVPCVMWDRGRLCVYRLFNVPGKSALPAIPSFLAGIGAAAPG